MTRIGSEEWLTLVKINFVRHVIRQMPLKGVEAMHIRAESLADDVSPGPLFDVVVCRALSESSAALALAKPLLAPGGRIILYRGPGNCAKPNSNGQVAVKGADFLQTVITYPLPYTHFSRRIDILDYRS
ncbi:MAG: class I SAM-dependent methyltransferase [Desulfobacteraceae bacterium]